MKTIILLVGLAITPVPAYGSDDGSGSTCALGNL